MTGGCAHGAAHGAQGAMRAQDVAMRVQPLSGGGDARGRHRIRHHSCWRRTWR